LLLEGAVEGGIYKYYKDYKGLTHEQSLAETFTPGLLAGRPEGVPWYGGSEALQEKELYEVKDEAGNVVGTKQNVKDFIDTQRNMDQIGTEYDKLESQKRDINEMRGYASQYVDTDYAHPRLDPRVGIENKQKALENEYLKLEQLNKPDALTGNYNAWLTAKEKQDTAQGLRATEAKKKRLGVVDIPWDDLSKPDYVLKGYERAQDRWEKEQSEKRYRQMREKFPGYSDKQIDEILAYYETSQPEVGMSYGELKKMFDIGDKQAYYADNFRMEKAGGGLTRTVAPDSGPMDQGLASTPEYDTYSKEYKWQI
jgi:cytochrome c553